MRNIINDDKYPDSQWYKKIWSLDIKDMSWVENTKNEIDFIIDTLELSGNERVLDLACGFGRHSIELAKRGYSVVGIDVTEEFIKEARRVAAQEKLNVEFICNDIRNINYRDEFDLVLNMADGAIGYLEDDTENMKIFDLIALSLRKDGKHFMNICNAKHAELYFPKRHWEIGKHSVSLPEFHWDKDHRRMLYGGWEITFGEIAKKPDAIDFHSSIRLYSIEEINNIFKDRGMKIIKTFGDFNKIIESSINEMQLLVYSKKV